MKEIAKWERYYTHISAHCPWRYRTHRSVPPLIDFTIARLPFKRHVREHPGYLDDLRKMNLL